MKFTRTNKEYGGGSGINRFDSSLFSVIVWKLQKGIRTSLNIKSTYKEIHFDGNIRLKTDKACFEQLSVTEIKEIISAKEKAAFKNGMQAKARELRKCLNLTNY